MLVCSSKQNKKLLKYSIYQFKLIRNINVGRYMKDCFLRLNSELRAFFSGYHYLDCKIWTISRWQ